VLRPVTACLVSAPEPIVCSVCVRVARPPPIARRCVTLTDCLSRGTGLALGARTGRLPQPAKVVLPVRRRRRRRQGRWRQGRRRQGRRPWQGRRPEGAWFCWPTREWRGRQGACRGAGEGARSTRVLRARLPLERTVTVCEPLRAALLGSCARRGLRRRDRDPSHRRVSRYGRVCMWRMTSEE